MGYLKVEYCLMGRLLADPFTKPLQGAAFHELRAEIQVISKDTPDTDLVCYRPENTFFPIPQEFVERSDVNTDKKTNDSQEGSPVECIRSQESNPVVYKMKGSPKGLIKSQEINPMVLTASYANILRRNILPS